MLSTCTGNEAVLPHPIHFPVQCWCPALPAHSSLLFVPFLGRRNSFSFRRSLRTVGAEWLGSGCRVLLVFGKGREGLWRGRSRSPRGAAPAAAASPGQRSGSGAAAPSRGGSRRCSWGLWGSTGSGKAGAQTCWAGPGFHPAGWARALHPRAGSQQVSVWDSSPHKGLSRNNKSCGGYF